MFFVEACNECTLFLIAYHFLLFSDLVSDPVTRYNLGWSLILTFFVMLVINLCIILTVTFKSLKHAYRVKRMNKLLQKRERQRQIIATMTMAQEKSI
jgi:hypothetical protein